ncbi:hypothetical protein MF672_026895 [Actinomadura sp. ATCC 31491]|uniref:Uncharacterized protein n=1 Tax=Actinomadura luzonensis TaxID=2805427 RepID=A0ABT0FYG1_9ACTN|nr:hypothetical protein [Actinomadura luzonensis]MCK2217389.1 hypothetical protein [Actinomadura luzonensis]
MLGPLGDIVVPDLSRAPAGPHAAFVGPDHEISTYFPAVHRASRGLVAEVGHPVPGRPQERRR